MNVDVYFQQFTEKLYNYAFNTTVIECSKKPLIENLYKFYSLLLDHPNISFDKNEFTLYIRSIYNIRSKQCIICIDKQPSFNYSTEIMSGLCCTTCKFENMIDVKNKKCRCGKHNPNFNRPGIKPAICCFTCRDDDMINVNSELCECGTRPTFNLPGKNFAVCCVKCKSDKMIDVKNKKCECGKIPNFNMPGKTPAICCATCKEEGMVNVTTKLCKCGKYPTFNFSDKINPICCDDCKEDGMVDIKHKKCKCGTRAIYNLPSKLIAEFCWSCSSDEMVDVAHNKCLECNERAYYNIYGLSPEYCFVHKTEQMIDNPTRQCISHNCKKLAIYGINYPEYCLPHKEEMKNSLISKVNKKCDKCNLHLLLNDNDLCFYCANPNYLVKKHELDIKHLYDDNEKYYTAYNKCINGIYYPDFLFESKYHSVITEVDEHQHRSYDKDKEVKRMTIIATDKKVPVIFIRYNPDNYRSFNKQKLIEGDKRKDIKTIRLLYEFERC
jgi:hypothetical protein